jgi:hypothetical protein
VTKRPYRKLLGAALALAVLAFLLYPITTVSVPEWRVQFVDRHNRPFARLPVEQIWLGPWQRESRRAEAVTDDDGYVVFPERTTWITRFGRLMEPAREAFTLPHENVGSPHSSSSVRPLCDVEPVERTAADYRTDYLSPRIMLRHADRSAMRARAGVARRPDCESIDRQAMEIEPAFR